MRRFLFMALFLLIALLLPYSLKADDASPCQSPVELPQALEHLPGD